MMCFIRSSVEVKTTNIVEYAVNGCKPCTMARVSEVHMLDLERGRESSGNLENEMEKMVNDGKDG